MYIQIIKFDSWVPYARTGVVVSALTYFINPMFIKAKGSVSFVFTLVLLEVLKCVDLSCLFFAANCAKLRHFISFFEFFWQEASLFSTVLCPQEGQNLFVTSK